MERIIKLIELNISGKKVLSLFILTNIIYVVMLTITIPKTMEFSNGMKLLDMMPMGYDFNYVNQLFSSLGVNGRETYLMIQIPVDMIYPLLFGISYCLLFAFFINKLDKLNTPYLYLGVLPILAGFADYIENFGIIILLKSYPNLTHSLVKVTNLFSMIKSITTSVFFIALFIALIFVGFKRIKKVSSGSIKSS